ncbi:hypothetical protein TNIN_114471 [Trichonephila inaurata madagascariensis]|uniref:Uncharacterized protein n=1 Tax=Trichonephila inaurata madagascariensis TaxID=2747483 RepID=A0A8X6Y1U0_9ARAC|nr:hypothetical protein TNIN_114471 [Trichonephila inaurata madagascariensis]
MRPLLTRAIGAAAAATAREEATMGAAGARRLMVVSWDEALAIEGTPAIHSLLSPSMRGPTARKGASTAAGAMREAGAAANAA